jgi:hypothetical protein
MDADRSVLVLLADGDATGAIEGAPSTNPPDAKNAVGADEVMEWVVAGVGIRNDEVGDDETALLLVVPPPIEIPWVAPSPPPPPAAADECDGDAEDEAAGHDQGDATPAGSAIVGEEAAAED